MIFVSSMRAPLLARTSRASIQDAFQVMTEAPQHTYQVLTERDLRAVHLADRLPWLAISVKNMTVTHRGASPCGVPAAVRFLSCESLLGSTGPDRHEMGWVMAGAEPDPRHRRIKVAWVWRRRVPKANRREVDGKRWDKMPVGR